MQEDQRKIKMYDEWRRFWDFWYQHPLLSMEEAFYAYMLELEKVDLTNKNL